MNKISVVIPLYNQSEYLEDCLESIYPQNVHEIIVVNDGSTDDSREVAERYMFKEFPGMESPVRVINQVNKGLPSARNTGIMNATGDYIFFLDADDIAKENAIESFTRAINETQADIIAPSFKEFGKRDREVILGQFTIEDLKAANRLPYCCCVKRSKLLEVGGYNPKMIHGAEDYDLWFDLFKRNATITFISSILVLYRTKDHSMYTETIKHEAEFREQIRKNHPTIWQ